MGCIPTKTQVGSAKAIATARRGAELGFKVRKVEVDWPRIRQRKDEVVTLTRGRLERKLDEDFRIDLIRGSARFLEPGRIDVDGEAFISTKTIIASGVAPVTPEIPGLIEAGFETNESVMDMEELPKAMVVIGGGPEGMEFSQLFHRLGVNVTVLQRRDRVLPREDAEISAHLESLLSSEGIDIRTNATPTAVERTGRGRLAVVAEIEGREMRFDCDRILVAAGRKPHEIGDLDLNSAGVAGDPDAGIEIDETLQTSNSNIWAMGDVIGRLQYTHFAVHTAGVAVDNALRSAGRSFETNRVPGAVFTDPEVASVGLTEAQALDTGRNVKVGKQLMRRVGRAIAIGETEGFIKVVVDGDTEELLGLHMISHFGADLLPQGVAMLHTPERGIGPLAEALYPHPTLSEALKTAVTSLRPASSEIAASADSDE